MCIIDKHSLDYSSLDVKGARTITVERCMRLKAMNMQSEQHYCKNT